LLNDEMQGSDTTRRAEADLIAGPPAASPPLTIALMLVALSIAGPFIFVTDGTPSLLLGITAVAVAIAGMITMVAAGRAYVRRRADAAARRRVRISFSGITFYPSVETSNSIFFSWDHITNVHVTQSAFIVQAGPAALKPGRHAIRFGKLVTPRADILSALEEIQSKVREPS
jgi:hypothetical protein